MLLLAVEVVGVVCVVVFFLHVVLCTVVADLADELTDTVSEKQKEIIMPFKVTSGLIKAHDVYIYFFS